MGKGDKVLKNNVYIKRVDQELNEVSSVYFLGRYTVRSRIIGT